MGGALLSRSLTRGNVSADDVRGAAVDTDRAAATTGAADDRGDDDEDVAPAAPDGSVLGPPR